MAPPRAYARLFLELFCLFFIIFTCKCSILQTEKNVNGILLKTRGWLKFQDNFIVSNLMIDFNLHSRSRVIVSDFNHKHHPLYRGRAVLSFNFKEKQNTKLRLISTSSLLKKSIYYDSDKLAFTQHFLDGSEEDIVTPTLSLEFHNFFSALHEELSNVSNSHWIPENVTIYDEAADRLCPSNLLSRHIVYFENQHYIFCVLRNDPETTNEKVFANLLQLRYIIGQEFTVQITSVEQASPSKIRGSNATNNFSFEQLFASSKNIKEELLIFKQKGRSVKEEKSYTNITLKDRFPKVRERGIKSFKSFISPAKAYFFNSVACKIPYLRNNDKCSQDEEKEEKKICLFLHGCGELEENKGLPLMNEYSKYWGPVADYTPQCSERWFIREETKNRGWDNTDLQQSYCDFMLLKHIPKFASPNSTNIVRNVIIYAHSMGNLIIAGALKNKICKLDRDTVSWYNLMGPMKGTKAVSVLKDVCENKVSIISPSIAKFVASKGGYCQAKSTKVYPTYETLQTTYQGISDLAAIAQPYIKGQMCGVSSTGLNSYYSPALGFLSKVVDFGEPNDGLVGISSCMIGDSSQFSSSHLAQNYVTEANHADGTCRFGDSWFGSVKPCSYFLSKK